MATDAYRRLARRPTPISRRVAPLGVTDGASRPSAKLAQEAAPPTDGRTWTGATPISDLTNGATRRRGPSDVGTKDSKLPAQCVALTKK